MITKVKIRQIAISKGRYSLYLDFYPAVRDWETMKMVRQKSLGLYIFQDPTTQARHEHNKNTLIKAEYIQSSYIQTFVNREYNFYDHSQMQSDFLDYFYSVAYKKGGRWMLVYTHFEKYTENKCIFKDITRDFCEKFREYLLNSYQLKHTNMKIKQNTASGYFSTFLSLLTTAYRCKLLREDISAQLDNIKKKEIRKEYLIPREIKKLMETSCEIPVLKSASLFSCFTGLRISDILELTWDKIVLAPDNEYCIRIKIRKNGAEVTLPISDDTLKLCGERTEGKVFKGLKTSMTHHPLKKWIKQAGIKKKISFHMARHSNFYFVLKTSKLQSHFS